MRKRLKIMKLKLLGLIFIWASLFYLAPVWASEDSAEYPFPDGFNFDDLPEIEELAPPEVFVESNSLKAESSTQEDLVENSKDKTKVEEIKNKNITNITKPNKDISLETLMLSKTTPSLEVLEQNTKTSKEPIFIPKRPDINTQQEDTFEKNKTLTETLKIESKDKSKNVLEGTWVEKITSSNPLSLMGIETKDSDNNKQESQLEELVKKSRNKDKSGKSNASVFDISGVMLRMNLKQVERTLENRGFRRINAKFEIPNFIKWRNEETCRNQGIVGYERLEACVISMAKKDGHQYLQYIKYAKFDSKEEIEVYFTSNFTENKVYKIVYKSTIASITGNSPKATYIRNIKVYDFWKKINQKYGQPDNKTNVTWGLGGDKPFLKASTGNLLLEDPMFREMDYTRMSREDQRFINSEFYNF